MPLDRITEIIAHFIGTMQMSGDAARLREAFDSFHGRPAPAAPEFDPVHVRVHVSSPYDLEGFDPGLRLDLPPPMPAQPTPLPLQFTALSGQGDAFGLDLELTGSAPSHALPQSGTVTWQIPLPPQVMTVTVQHLYLSDNDILSDSGTNSFGDVSGLAAMLHQQAAAAAALGGALSAAFEELMPEPGFPTVEASLTFAQNVVALSAEEGPMPLIRLPVATPPATGDDAAGTTSLPETTLGSEPEPATETEPAVPSRIHVNATPAEVMPTPDDHLPEVIAERINPPEASQTDAPETPAGPSDSYAVPEGHHLSTGGNLTVNEAYISANGVDADVIVIGGDRIAIDAISQVNLALVGQEAEGGIAGSEAEDEARDEAEAALGHLTRALNAARIDPAQSQPDPEGDDEGPDLPLPQYWQVQRIEGDVVLQNLIEQHIFATDNDQVETGFSASASRITTGDNTLSNFTGLQALSMHYDVVITGGSYVTLNLIQQVNVLLDTDQLLTPLPGGGLNWGANLLMNSAEILHGGLDLMRDLPQAFAEGLADLAGGGTGLSAAVARDPVMAGHDYLSVLYIAGDLIEQNIIRQFSYLADADQIALAETEALAAAMTAGLQIDTGQNAMLNAARINDLGIASTVMTAGQVYSDALIHQAGLIDGVAPGSDGLALPVTALPVALANEALAFLMPDAEEAGAAGLTGRGDHATAHDGPMGPDGLHVLAA